MFYVYAYLREDGTPYYIGKGKDRRAWVKGKGEVYHPVDESRIKIIKENLSEADAFVLEKALISQYGRKDLGTGILRNKSDGGEGPVGAKRSIETREKMSVAHIGKKFSEQHKQKLSASHSGKKLTTEHKKRITEANLKRFSKEEERRKLAKLGELNSNASVWRITKPDGTTEIITSLTTWCKENNVPRDRVRLSQCGWKCENLGKKKDFKG